MRKKKALAPQPPALEPNYIWNKVAPLKITDGDSFDLCVSMGFRVRADVTIRLQGCNCPDKEKDPVGFEAARRFTAAAIDDGKGVIVHSQFEEKWRRYLGEVWVPKDGALVNLSQLLIDTGHASPYDGGKR